MPILLFTDTLFDVNGVSRFIRDMGEQAAAVGRAGGSEQRADRLSANATNGNDAIVHDNAPAASTLGAALRLAAHGDLFQKALRSWAVGRAQFRRIKVAEANLNPFARIRRHADT